MPVHFAAAQALKGCQLGGKPEDCRGHFIETVDCFIVMYFNDSF